MTLPITSLYTLPLAVIFLALWVHVSKARAAMGVSIGDAGDVALLERIRRHGNFTEWVPMLLILLALAETAGAAVWALHCAGALIVIGRLVHPFGLLAAKPNHLLRIAGNSCNLLATAILIVVLTMASF